MRSIIIFFLAISLFFANGMGTVLIESIYKSIGQTNHNKKGFEKERVTNEKTTDDSADENDNLDDCIAPLNSCSGKIALKKTTYPPLEKVRISEVQKSVLILPPNF